MNEIVNNDVMLLINRLLHCGARNNMGIIPFFKLGMPYKLKSTQLQLYYVHSNTIYQQLGVFEFALFDYMIS